MKMKSKYLAIGAIIFAMVSATGCGNGKNNSSSPAETSLPVKASESVVGAVENDTATEAEAETQADVVSETTPAVSETETDSRLVPKVEANLADDIPLATVLIGDEEIEINLLTCTMTEMREKLSVGKRGSSAKYTHDKDDFYFFGEAFSPSPSGSKFNLELLENGEVVTDYTMDKDEDYTIKALSMKDETSSDNEYVIFYNGITVGNYKEQIEEKLGKGYDVADSEKEDTMYSYYKNSQATMVIEYDISDRNGTTAKRITVILNG